MGTKFLALGLSLFLVLSSFYEVSCQDEGHTGLSLDLIERESQAIVNYLQGTEGEGQSGSQISGQKNSSVTDNDTVSLSLSEESADTSSQLGAVTDEVVKPSSMLDHLVLEFEAHINELKQAASDGIKKVDESTKDDERLAAQRKKMLEEIEREFEAAAAGLEKFKIDDSTQGKDDEQSAMIQSMLDEIERDFEAATKGLEQLKADDLTGANDAEHAATRQKMMEEIEREFEEATKGLGELMHSTSSTDDESHSAKRKSMLDEIEREFEAASSGLQQLKINDFTGEDDVKKQPATKQSMLDAIEREFEAHSFRQPVDLTDDKHKADQYAKTKSMLDDIEREFEAAAAASSLKQLKLGDITEGDNRARSNSFKQPVDLTDDKDKEEKHARTKKMLDEIEREFEAAAAASSLKQLKLGDITEGDDCAQNGVCGCFKQGKNGLDVDTDSKINIADILAEKSQGSTKPSLTTKLNDLFHNHRKETSRVFGSSVTPPTSESSATSESIESLKLFLKKLRGLSARELVYHPDFDKIIEAGTRYELLSSASIGYISLLAKYKTVIKEGLEASHRVHIAQTHAKILKQSAMKKQRAVDAEFASAKTLAQRGEALSIRIFAIKKLLDKLEAEKLNIVQEFKSTKTNIARLLKEASQAYEEYHVAGRKAKDEQAAEEFALETTKRAEHIWVEFLNSLN